MYVSRLGRHPACLDWAATLPTLLDLARQLPPTTQKWMRAGSMVIGGVRKYAFQSLGGLSAKCAEEIGHILTSRADAYVYGDTRLFACALRVRGPVVSQIYLVILWQRHNSFHITSYH